jgi:hypothetical protein
LHPASDFLLGKTGIAYVDFGWSGEPLVALQAHGLVPAAKQVDPL